jgi:hypothetical protein
VGKKIIKSECLFCGAWVTPVETGGINGISWIFECECGAIVESYGPELPRIQVVNRPFILEREDLNFDDESYF